MKQPLIILFLAILAMGSYWLLSDLKNSFVADDEDNDIKPIVTGHQVKVLFFDEKNRLKYQVDSEKMTEYSNNGGSKLSTAKIQSLNEKQKLDWVGEATTIAITTDRKRITLNDNVEIIKQPNSGDPLYVTGDNIIYYADKEEILGNKPIVIKNNETRQMGRRFKMNINNKKAHFAGGTHAFFQAATAISNTPNNQNNIETASNNARINAQKNKHFADVEQALPITLQPQQTADTLKEPKPDTAKIGTIDVLIPTKTNINTLITLTPDASTLNRLKPLTPKATANIQPLKTLTPEIATKITQLKSLKPEYEASAVSIKEITIPTLNPDFDTTPFFKEPLDQIPTTNDIAFDYIEKTPMTDKTTDEIVFESIGEIPTTDVITFEAMSEIPTTTDVITFEAINEIPMANEMIFESTGETSTNIMTFEAIDEIPMANEIMFESTGETSTTNIMTFEAIDEIPMANEMIFEYTSQP